MCELGLLFGDKLSHFKFEIHVVMHLSQRSVQTRCQNTILSVQMRWLLKEMEDGTLIGLLHVTPKTHLLVFRPTHFRFASDARVIYPSYSSNSARSAHKATGVSLFILAFQIGKYGP